MLLLTPQSAATDTSLKRLLLVLGSLVATNDPSTSNSLLEEADMQLLCVPAITPQSAATDTSLKRLLLVLGSLVATNDPSTSNSLLEEADMQLLCVPAITTPYVSLY